MYNILLFYHLIRSKRQILSSLTDEVNLYKETIIAKDHVVVELTNKVTTLILLR